MLISPHLYRERILGYGQEGVGKSRMYWAIAKALRETNSPGHVYVLDLDNAWQRMASGFPGYESNMSLYQPETYPQMLAQGLKVKSKATMDDWLSVDGMGEAWDSTQEEYASRAEGQDLVSWMLESSKKQDYGKSANAQNKMWREMGKLLRTFPGHVICCSPAQQVMEKADGSVMDSRQSRYQSVGWRPMGQNTLGYLFHTVLYLNVIGDRFIYSTVKDREREVKTNTKLVDFPTDYLMKVGGWKA